MRCEPVKINIDNDAAISVAKYNEDDAGNKHVTWLIELLFYTYHSYVRIYPLQIDTYCDCGRNFFSYDYRKVRYRTVPYHNIFHLHFYHFSRYTLLISTVHRSLEEYYKNL